MAHIKLHNHIHIRRLTPSGSGLPDATFCIPKIPIWVYVFWRALERKMVAIWNILGRFGIFYGHLVYFKAIWYRCLMAICYILRPFRIYYGHLVYFMAIWYIFPVLVCCTKKNLATLFLKVLFLVNIFHFEFRSNSTPAKREQRCSWQQYQF
jgi:hypothetical protein